MNGDVYRREKDREPEDQAGQVRGFYRGGADFTEAARIIDADAQLQEEGCVYEVTKEDEHEPDKESA